MTRTSHKYNYRRIVLLVVLGVIFKLTGCNRVTSTAKVDESALKYLEMQENADVSAVAQQLAEIKDNTENSEDFSDENGSNESEEKELPTEIHLAIETIRAELAAGTVPSGVLSPYQVSTLAESEIPKLRSLYSNTIIIGNSRAKSILDSGILTSNEVLYKWASHVDEMMDITIQAAGLYRENVLFIMGVNDMGYYCANTEGFKRDYIALIDAYREINPDGNIYLQEIIPINEEYGFRWKNMHRVTAYNAIIREICEEKNCTMVTSVYYAIPEFLADDGTGAHYNYQYHVYWAQTMANQMGLWEDEYEKSNSY